MARANFDVYKHKVSIKTRLGEQEFELLPLSGRFYPKLMSVVRKFPQDEAASSEFLNSLDEETVAKIHELCFETLKYSERVSEKGELEKLDMFVSQNLFPVFNAVVEVNLGQSNEE